MALSVLLHGGQSFHHELRHDLESLLYVILWVCTHMAAPEVERSDTAGLNIRQWCDMQLNLKELGYRKLGHIVKAQTEILPQLAPYWDDFKPFITELLDAFFAGNPAQPNKITPEAMCDILERAKKAVTEPQEQSASASQCGTAAGGMTTHSYLALATGKKDRQGECDAPASKKRRVQETRNKSGVFGGWCDSVG